MKKKEYKKNYNSKVKKDNKTISRKRDIHWILTVTILAFVISFVLSIFSETALEGVSTWICLLIIFLFIAFGIIFDMIGIAVTVADRKVFHSMATKRVKGAKTPLSLMNNASKVSSFCNDVIGDICGILSGTAASTVAILLANSWKVNPFFIALISTSLIASLTIGGKAFGKSIAINKSNEILYRFARVLCIFVKEK